jgi:hypothetical protein
MHSFIVYEDYFVVCV